MKENKSYWLRQVPGIPDDCFHRGKVPMTKEEVRVVTLAKGKLFPEAIVYDIGAGTGSLSIEAALLAYEGQVWAFERKPEAVELIKKNRDFFQVDNLHILAQEAPAGLADLPEADVIFLGGSGGRLGEILEFCLLKLKPQGRIVVNAITNETLQRTLDFSQAQDLAYEVVTVAVTRMEKIGSYHMWKGLNPVQIITLTRK